jgi:hypothetical protein
MAAPGANKSRKLALFEKLDTTSSRCPELPSPTEPTLIAVEMHAGAVNRVELPLFPELITVKMPAARKVSMIGFRASASQATDDRSPPRLMLTAAMLNACRRAYTRSSAAI